MLVELILCRVLEEYCTVIQCELTAVATWVDRFLNAAELGFARSAVKFCWSLNSNAIVATDAGAQRIGQNELLEVDIANYVVRLISNKDVLTHG